MPDLVVPNDLASPLPHILDCPSLNLLAGATGLGKTALIASLAVAFRDGTPIFGEQPNPIPAIAYVCCDRPKQSAIKWFTAAGFPDIPIYSIIDDRKFDLTQLHGGKHGPTLLAHCIDSLKLPVGAVVFVDPIALFMGGKISDYNSTSVACTLIQRYVIDVGYTVIGTAHTSKLKADVADRYARPEDRIIGSTAAQGYSSTKMYLMGADEGGRDDGRFTFRWISHHHPAAEFTFTRADNGLFLIDGAVKTPTPDTRDSASSAKPDDPKLLAVLGMIPEYPETISTAELIGNCPYIEPPVTSIRTLYRFLTNLQEVGKVESPAKGAWRRVPVLS